MADQKVFRDEMSGAGVITTRSPELGTWEVSSTSSNLVVADGYLSANNVMYGAAEATTGLYSHGTATTGYVETTITKQTWSYKIAFNLSTRQSVGGSASQRVCTLWYGFTDTGVEYMQFDGNIDARINLPDACSAMGFGQTYRLRMEYTLSGTTLRIIEAVSGMEIFTQFIARVTELTSLDDCFVLVGMTNEGWINYQVLDRIEAGYVSADPPAVGTDFWKDFVGAYQV